MIQHVTVILASVYQPRGGGELSNVCVNEVHQSIFVNVASFPGPFRPVQNVGPHSKKTKTHRIHETKSIWYGLYTYCQPSYLWYSTTMYHHFHIFHKSTKLFILYSGTLSCAAKLFSGGCHIYKMPLITEVTLNAVQI